jgi:large subunit ribosomal protein L6
MSRIGKKPVPIGTAKVAVEGQLVRVEGPKGKLEIRVHPAITVSVDTGKKELAVTRRDDQAESRALHGLTRALVANMVEGVTNGYKRSLDVQGVGYRAELAGKKLLLTVGFANQISLDVPSTVNVAVEGSKIHVTGPDKQQVGEFASQVRRVRKPEPYKGKGIRYDGEQVKIKPGKAVTGAAAK